MSRPTNGLDRLPYRRKWTQAQVDEIRARERRLQEVMLDPVGYDGTSMYIDGQILQLLALHMAIAGCEVHEELAYITPIIHPQRDGLPVNFHEWVLKSEYQPAPPDPDVTRAKAVAAADQIKRQLPAEVREALKKIMIDDKEGD